MASSYDEVMESKNFFAFNIGHLTPRMIQMAKEELNENEKTRASSIEQLRELIIKDKNLKCRTDDEFLLQFLRARRFDVKKSFTRLQSLYQVMSKTFSDLFTDFEDERAKCAFGSGFGSHLPYRDRDGAAVVLFRMSNWNTEDFDINSIVHCLCAGLLSAVDYPATQVCGLQLLVDTEGTSLRQMRRIGHRILYLLSKGLSDTLPIRYNGIHFINTSRIFRYIWAIINVFLSEKLRKRVHFHGDSLESLHKFIPEEILPLKYGGANPDFDPVGQGTAELEKFLPKYLRIIHDGYEKE